LESCIFPNLAFWIILTYDMNKITDVIRTVEPFLLAHPATSAAYHYHVHDKLLNVML